MKLLKVFIVFQMIALIALAAANIMQSKQINFLTHEIKELKEDNQRRELNEIKKKIDDFIDKNFYRDTEKKCLAENIYHEARGESIKGQRFVADVTLNRVESGKYGNGICGVVYQNKQFSWTETTVDVNYESKEWKTALKVAETAMQSKHKTTATHYHADYVKPYWTKSMIVVASVGRHKFYKD